MGVGMMAGDPSPACELKPQKTMIQPHVTAGVPGWLAYPLRRRVPTQMTSGGPQGYHRRAAGRAVGGAHVTCFDADAASIYDMYKVTLGLDAGYSCHYNLTLLLAT